MHDDDKPIGRVLSRREALAMLGGLGVAFFIGTSKTVRAQDDDLPACVVVPELAAGPFFVDTELERVDIRYDGNVDADDEDINPIAGMPLVLQFRVSQVVRGQASCTPLRDAQVDVWQCDAIGRYSGVNDARSAAQEETWLRGYQFTDRQGRAELITIVPGWYPGRAVHIHFKIRTPQTERNNYEFNSQLFFQPRQIAALYEQAPYAERGLPDVPNERDFIFQRGDDALTLALEELDEDELEQFNLSEGYKALFDVGLVLPR